MRAQSSLFSDKFEAKSALVIRKKFTKEKNNSKQFFCSNSFSPDFSSFFAYLWSSAKDYHDNGFCSHETAGLACNR